ncbi:MAG: hypothetical protein RLZZ303_1730 [Candidatus Hydrogenedentota bacterium]
MWRSMLAVAAVLTGSLSSTAQAELDGRWISDGGDVAVTLRFDTIDAEAAAELDLPKYDVVGVPLRPAEVIEDRIHLRSADKDFVVSLDLQRDGEALSGSWNLRGREAPIRLIREERPFPFRVEKTSYDNAGLRLVAHLFLPTGDGPHPALVFFHGSGDNMRHHYFSEATFLAEQGVAVLVPDKRGNHESEGNWKDVGFDALAEDGIAGVRHLMQRDDIQADRIGVIGISQACWIMPLAATKCPDIRFIVAISGAMVSVEEEGFYDFDWRLQQAGYGEEIRGRARALVELDNAVTRGTADMAALVAEIKAVRKEPWFKAMEFHPAPHGVADRAFYGRIIDHDPMPLWRELHLPVLFVYGMEDESVDAPTSIALLRPLLDEPGRDFTLKTFEGANHGIRVPGLEAKGVPLMKHAPGYYDTLATWLREKNFAPAP